MKITNYARNARTIPIKLIEYDFLQVVKFPVARLARAYATPTAALSLNLRSIGELEFLTISGVLPFPNKLRS